MGVPLLDIVQKVGYRPDGFRKTCQVYRPPQLYHGLLYTINQVAYVCQLVLYSKSSAEAKQPMRQQM